MTPDITNEILKRLDLVGAKLSVSAGQIFSTLTAQAHVMGVENLIGAGALIGAAGISTIYLRWGLRGWKTTKEQNLTRTDHYYDKDPQDRHTAGVIIGSILTVAFTFLSLIPALAAYADFANPQFWALEQLLEVLR